MFAFTYRALLVLICCLTALAAGCSSDSLSEGEPATAELLQGFPDPLAVNRSTSVNDGARIREGDKYEIGTQHNTAADTGGESYNPQWGPGQEGLEYCAYAIYRFPLDDYSGEPEITFKWYTSPPATENIWIGLPHFDQNRWTWRSYPATHKLTYNPLQPHFDADGDLLVALVVMGSDSAVLDYIRVGPDVAPICGISPDVSLGYAPLMVSLTAWGFDIDGTIEKFEFDALGDGTWFDNGLQDTYGFEYTAIGQYTPKVRVTDSGGNQAVAETRVGVGWQHTWGGTGFEEGIHAGRRSDGSVVVLGLTTSFGEGANENLLLCYNESGNLLWQKTFGVSTGEHPTAIVLDAADNIYLACSALDISGHYSSVVAKLDADGNLLAQKKYSLADSTEAVELVLGPADRLNMLCNHDRPGVADNDFDIVLLKFNTADLSLISAKSWDAGFDDSPTGMAVDAVDNVYILGRTNSFSTENSTFNAVLLSLSASGDERWAKVCGLDLQTEAAGLSLNNGSLFFSASNRVIRTDIGGAIELQIELSWTSEDFECSIVQGRPDGGCLLAGFLNEGFLSGLFVVLDPEFLLTAEAKFGQPEVHDAFHSILPDGTGSLYFTGRGKDNNGSWSEVSLNIEDPGLTMTEVTGEATLGTPAGTLSNWTGVLSDVPPGSETQDTGGGSDDLLITRVFP